MADCTDLVEGIDVTIDQLKIWNSWIGSDCDNGLYADLNETDSRAVCIGVNNIKPTVTFSGESRTTATQTTTGSSSMGPTQTGIISGCSAYHTVESGDSCGSIEAQNGITFDQFLAWNPAGKSSAP